MYVDFFSMFKLNLCFKYKKNYIGSDKIIINLIIVSDALLNHTIISKYCKLCIFLEKGQAIGLKA